MNKNLPILYSEIQAANKRIEKIKLMAMLCANMNLLPFQKDLVIKLAWSDGHPQMYLITPRYSGRTHFKRLYHELLDELKGDNK